MTSKSGQGCHEMERHPQHCTNKRRNSQRETGKVTTERQVQTDIKQLRDEQNAQHVQRLFDYRQMQDPNSE
jgi:hypothetical protein